MIAVMSDLATTIRGKKQSPRAGFASFFTLTALNLDPTHLPFRSISSEWKVSVSRKITTHE